MGLFLLYWGEDANGAPPRASTPPSGGRERFRFRIVPQLAVFPFRFEQHLTVRERTEKDAPVLVAGQRLCYTFERRSTDRYSARDSASVRSI